MALFTSVALSLLLNIVFGKQIGNVACSWRISFSPDARAFRIWGVIYVWTLVSFVYQLSDAFAWLGWHAYASVPWVNLMAAGAWGFCGLWVIAFGQAAGTDAPGGLLLATAFIAAAAALALAATITERAWKYASADRLLVVGAPLSLFAGWLMTALAVGTGTTVLAWSGQPSACRGRYDDERYSTFTRSRYEDSVSFASNVPVVLALAVSAGAFVVCDPVLPLPLIWGIYHMKGHLKNWLAIELLAVSSVACLAQWAGQLWFL